jgi:hypothetical protein
VSQVNQIRNTGLSVGAEHTLEAHWQLFLVEGIGLIVLGIGALILPPLASIGVAIELSPVLKTPSLGVSMEPEVGDGTTDFTREFKLEAVKLVKERGFAMAQASRDLGLYVIPNFPLSLAARGYLTAKKIVEHPKAIFGFVLI